jgi:hypothetical protein
MTDINGAKSHCVHVHQIPWRGSLHDLTSWATLLIEERKLRGAPYDPAFARRLSSVVNRIYQRWRERFRYHANRPYLGEVETTLAAVDWLVHHDSDL